MPAKNGAARTNGTNAPPLSHVFGNCAAHVCSLCGGAYGVSAYAHHQSRKRDAGWIVCPHCHGTEATIWFERLERHSKWDIQKVYMTAQRILSEKERELALKSKPTARGNLRIMHGERTYKSNRFR